MAAINPLSEAERISLTNSAKNRTPTSNMDKDDFLKLLCTQLKNQDPMNPMEDMEFIGEMAQFSSLEQMLNVNSNIENISKQIAGNKTTQAMSFLGATVTADISDDDGNPVSGKVEMVGLSDGEPYLKVGQYALTLDQIKLASY
jgi:flagellar basal-body rod modification protein FlgD